MDKAKRKILEALFFGRFEPVQTMLSVSAFLHGIWLISSMIISSMILGGMMISASAFVLYALWNGWRPKHTEFFLFLCWLFFAVLGIVAHSAPPIIWLPYSTIALASAITYLNNSLGLSYGRS